MAQDWGTAFGTAFTNALEQGARQAEQLAQERRMQILLDATMYSKGFDRVSDPDEIKGILAKTYQEQKAYDKGKVTGYQVAGGGAVGIPEGGSFKDGIIYDKHGKQAGSYLEGIGEPQKTSSFVKTFGKDMIKAGNLFYKPKEKGTTIEDLNAVKKELEASYSGEGVWSPAYRNDEGKTTWKYQDSPTEQMGIRPQQQQPQIQPQVYEQPQQQIQPPKDWLAMRGAVSNAINQKASLEEITQGIESSGFNASDFADLLGDYQKKQKTMKLASLLPDTSGKVSYQQNMGRTSVPFIPFSVTDQERYPKQNLNQKGRIV